MKSSGAHKVKMPIPIRCFSCMKVTGHLYNKLYKYRDEEKLSWKDTLEKIGLKRVCCRATIMSWIDLDEVKLRFDGMDQDIEAINHSMYNLQLNNDS